MISGIEYDRQQPRIKQELTNSITRTFLHINMSRREDIIHLYNNFRTRLCEVIKKGKHL